MGLGGSNTLDVPGENLPGVRDAIDFIEELRQAPDKSQVTIGDEVVVIGGGNTAIDAAVQARRLGARRVRSEEHTSELQSLMRISYAVFCLKKKNIAKDGEDKNQIQATASK